MPAVSFDEELAAYSHEAWSGWMRYMFTQGTHNPDGTWTMPKDKASRWLRQMNTPYVNLPEEEKLSDRKEAREILEIVQRHTEETIRTFFFGPDPM